MHSFKATTKTLALITNGLFYSDKLEKAVIVLSEKYAVKRTVYGEYFLKKSKTSKIKIDAEVIFKELVVQGLREGIEYQMYMLNKGEEIVEKYGKEHYRINNLSIDKKRNKVK